MLRLYVALLAVFSASPLAAQDVSFPPPPRARSPLPIASKLHELEQLAGSGSVASAELARRCRLASVEQRADGAVLVEIAGPDHGSAVDPGLVAAHGGEVIRSWMSYSKVWVPLASLSALAGSLAEGYSITPLGKAEADVTGEGPFVTRSNDYRDAGMDGTGLTIAVIDLGYSGLGTLQGAGEAPPAAAVTTIDYTLSASFASGGSHGTRCVANIYDHAPNAQYRLYKLGNSITDLGTAVSDAIANGADIISHSLSWYNVGWADDSGPICSAATAAAAAGVLFFTSAGNRAQEHWQGAYFDPDADGWHDFVAGDESIDVEVGAGEQVTFRLQWDLAPGASDYDLLLFDTMGAPLAGSSSSGTMFEAFSYSNDTGATHTVRLMVNKASGPSAGLEIFMTRKYRAPAVWLEHIVTGSSTTSPSNSTHPNVICIGAVSHLDFERASGSSGIIMDYSGRGPSNDGLLLPDLVSPTDTRYDGETSFGGTSCATPNAAGVAAVLMSCSGGPSAEQVREQLLTWARCLKDWGPAGDDIDYGAGGINIPELADCSGVAGPDACEILLGSATDENCNGRVDNLACEGALDLFDIPGALEGYSPLTGSLAFQAVVRGVGSPFTPGFPGDFQGFAMGIGHDPGTLEPIAVTPIGILPQMNGGQGPEFFSAAILDDGITVGVVTDFQAQELLDFAEPRALIGIEYAPEPQLLAGNLDGIETELFFSNDIGNPPVQNELVDAQGNTILPSFSAGLVELLPEPDFRFSAGYPDLELGPNQSVPYDPTTGLVDGPVSVFLHVRQTSIPQQPCIDTDGYVITLGHDPQLLSVVDVTTLDPNPDFVDVQIGPDVIFISVLGSMPCFDQEVPVVEVKYGVVPGPLTGDTDGATTPLLWNDAPGANAMVITANPLAEVARLHGELRFEPIAPQPEFIRGDVTADGGLNLADAVTLLNYLFTPGTPVPGCLDAADVDDSGGTGLADGIILLNYLFTPGSSAPAAPFPDCGVDPTVDALGCDDYPPCG